MDFHFKLAKLHIDLFNLQNNTVYIGEKQEKPIL